MLGKIRRQISLWYKTDPYFFLFVGVMTIVVYSFSWGNVFISDDVWGIRDNPELGNFWPHVLSLNIKEVSFSLIYIIFGPNPFWFHIHNTIIHLLTVYLVYTLVSLLTHETITRRLTTLLFALHPIEIEGVTWISGVPYAIQALFATTILILYILIEKRRLTRKWIIVPSLLYLTIMKVTPTMIVLPAIALCYSLIFEKHRKESFKLVAPLIGIGMLYSVSIYMQVFQRLEAVNPSYRGDPTVFNPLLQIPTALGTYMQLLLLPYNLTLYHEFIMYSPVLYIINVIATLLLLIALPVFWKYQKVVAFGFLLFVISLSPTLVPINIGWIVAERYVHFGSIGFFIALTAGAHALFKRFKVSADSILMGSVVLVCILSGLTIKRNLDWRNEDTLWPVTLKYSPFSAYAYNNMGDYYGRHGDVQNAIIAFERARLLRPRYSEATHNLANVYVAIGQATKAAELYKESLDFNPTLYISYQKLALIAAGYKNYPETEQYLLKSIEINPDPFTDYVMLARIYALSGDAEHARASFDKAYQYANNDPQRLLILQQLQTTP